MKINYIPFPQAGTGASPVPIIRGRLRPLLYCKVFQSQLKHVVFILNLIPEPIRKLHQKGVIGWGAEQLTIILP